MSWTPEQTETLARLWREGKTMSAIAAELQVQLNAVAGKIFRMRKDPSLGLEPPAGRPTKGRARSGARRRAASPPREQFEPGLQRSSISSDQDRWLRQHGAPITLPTISW